MLKKIVGLIAVLMILTSSIALCSDYVGHWSEETIKVFVEKGILQGDENGNINPDNNITRAEFVKVLNKAMGYTRKGTEQYKDIYGEEWYAEEFLIAKEMGYITGDENGNANPNDYITRAEVSVILSRILLLESESKLEFIDEEEIPEWSYKGIAGLVKEGLINGYEDNTFRANNRITRAESFTLIKRVISKQEKLDVLKDLKENNKELEVTYREDGNIGIITGIELKENINNANDVKKALEEIKDVYGIKNVEEEFRIEERSTEKRYVLQQIYKGLEVYGREIILVLNKNKKIDFINSTYVSNIDISINPVIDKQEAEDKVKGVIEKTELLIYINDTTPILVWSIETLGEQIFIDAKTGEIIKIMTYSFSDVKNEVDASGLEINGTEHKFKVLKYADNYVLGNKRIQITSIQTDDFKHNPEEDNWESIVSTDNNWSGKLNINNSVFGDRLGIIAVTVYNNVSQADDFYTNILKDNNYNMHDIYIVTNGYELINNAGAYYYSNPKKDGHIVLGIDDNFDDIVENDVSRGIHLDTVAHEMTHLITNKIVEWSDDNEPSTLNEGYADVMSELIQLYYNEDDGDWNRERTAGIYRSASNPETYGHPSKVGGEYYDEYFSESHQNMTVISRAAYLMYKNGINNEEKLAKLWYNSLLYLNTSSGFIDCRYAVEKSAIELGFSYNERLIISKAFDEVGIEKKPNTDIEDLKEYTPEMIVVKLCGQEYNATYADPMVEGGFLASIAVENRTGDNITKWQLLNYRTGQYEEVELKYGEIELKESFYRPLGDNHYVITIVASVDKGVDIYKDVYVNFITLTNPINGSIVNKDDELVIQWTGDPNREYRLKMAKYFLDENGNEIEEQKLLLMDRTIKGNEYELEKIGTAGNYRIALRDEKGQFYSIILFKAE